MLELTGPRQSDHRFIIGSFLSSYRGSNYAGPIPHNRWHEVMGPIALELLLGENVTTIVARHPNEDNTNVDIYGWLAVRKLPKPVVVYCYVKSLYRNHGLARRMMKAAGVDPEGPFLYGCSTKDCRDIANKGLIPRAKFDPRSIRK